MNNIDVKLNYIELDYIRQSLEGQIEYLLRCRLLRNDQIGHDFKELETLHAKIKVDCIINRKQELIGSEQQEKTNVQEKTKRR